MSKTGMAVVALAALIWLGFWLSSRAAGLADVGLLPARCRRRVSWWQAKARYVELTCISVAVVAACIQVGSTVG
jgi:hypothetical protein